MEFWIPFFALLGAGLTALVNWLVVKRRASGKIRTSEAADLWKESQAIRQELRTEQQGLKQEIVDLKKEVVDCHAESAQIKARLAALERGETGNGRGGAHQA